ncbi:MAG TPA: hypothetical protein VG276_28205 [Actinomycetes bacterium]|jgi:hypothetical protein|nr:hypothetical protein [Actinomycetes bacterium]
MDLGSRIRSLPRALVRRPDEPTVLPTEQQLSELADLAVTRRQPAHWATEAGYVQAARRLLTVMGARVGGNNRIAATMARVMGASNDPAGQLERLRAECRQIDSALSKLRTLHTQEAERAGETDGIEPLAEVRRKARGATR